MLVVLDFVFLDMPSLGESLQISVNHPDVAIGASK
jgi:hypothetical protein